MSRRREAWYMIAVKETAHLLAPIRRHHIVAPIGRWLVLLVLLILLLWSIILRRPRSVFLAVE
jgi:hypothetical protein